MENYFMDSEGELEDERMAGNRRFLHASKTRKEMPEFGADFNTEGKVPL
jgi:hypothetical protein